MAIFLAIGAPLLGGSPALFAADADTLTNAVDILKLTAQQARIGRRVSVTGVVTAAEPGWKGRFFMQDASGGVFVESISTNRQPKPGDVVAVTGLTRSGGYAPCITKPHWEKIGTAPLPEPKPVTVEQLMSGKEDSQRVEISGVVRTAEKSGSRLGVELVAGGYRFRAFAPFGAGTDVPALVGARMLVRATVATSYNAPLRHFLTVTLFAPSPGDFVIQAAAPTNLFAVPLTPLNGIAQYRRDNPLGGEVHVRGVVTYQRRGEDIFLQDKTGGLQIKTRQTNAVAPGDVVEAIGFPAVDDFLPVLEDAVFRKVSEPRQELRIQPATPAELLGGLHNADYVSIKGMLIDRFVRKLEETGTRPSFLTTLVLQTTNFCLVAENTSPVESKLVTAIPIGSTVELTGVCLLQSGDTSKIKSARLLLPAARDIRVLARPSWLTPRRLLTILGIVFIVLLVAVSWVVMLSQKNFLLKLLVREKESAQAELQEAHDQLEERVKQRTAQLKVEMTARKESELQFRAVLTERIRLAQELHDILEQTMTGSALQLDLVASQFHKNPNGAAHHLKLARRLMQKSQLAVRQSVWGLRSRTEEEFNLVNAIGINSRQIINGAGMRLEIQTAGEAGALSEVVEENLLRISQEAVTNAVKHSGAKLVKIEITFEPRRVALRIQDDGRGFSPESCPGPKDGHFGLLGIHERAQHVGGSVQIASTSGAGTTVLVEIPVADPTDPTPPA
jgi:signal transduction histidine kinase